MPAAARAAELERALAGLDDRLVAARTIVTDLEREQAKADADVDLVRQRAAKDQQLLDSGGITNAKQLESLRQELQSLARRQSDLEDIELEVMERLEGAEAAQTALAGERAAVAAELAEVVAERDEALAGLDADAAGARAEREALAAEMDPDLLRLYEKLRADHGGVGAAALYRGRCEGCRLQLPPVDVERIRVAAPDEVLRCEECRRILVRTAESGL